MTQLLLVVADLDTGGAQRQALELAAGLTGRGLDVTLAALHTGGGLEEEARRRLGPGLAVLCPARRWRRRDLPAAAARLVALARRLRPGVVYGFQPVVNELALAAARASGARTAWGLRFSDVAWGRYSLGQAAAYRLGAVLSRAVDVLVANSAAGLALARRAGYRPRAAVVVPNGIDTARFRPDPEARARVRAAWGVAPDAPLVAQVGRMDPMKDWPNFLRACALLRRQVPGLRVACVGPGTAEALGGAVAGWGLADCAVLPGAREDMPAVYAALDALALASAYGEGFPNVVGEAMACGVPCAVTTVGDAAEVAGPAGRAVPPRDHRALAGALGALLTAPGLERARLALAARARVETHFTLAAMVDRTLDALGPLLEGR